MEWIKGYEGRYKITEQGHVYSLLSGRYLSPTIRNKSETRPKDRQNDYLAIGLYKKGDRQAKLHSIHRLVAETYIPNPDNLPEVNHKDGNKRNNDVSNLEWSTRSGNAKHSWDTGLQKTSGRKFTNEQVRFIRSQEGLVSRYELSERFGVSEKTIQSIQKRYTYKYVK